jgi:hypothetical protein
MMEKMKEYYEGDVKSLIVDIMMYIIYVVVCIISYVEVVYILIDVLIRHNALDGRGTFVFQMLSTVKDQFSMWLGAIIRNYVENLASDLDFKSDARL